MRQLCPGGCFKTTLGRLVDRIETFCVCSNGRVAGLGMFGKVWCGEI